MTSDDEDDGIQLIDILIQEITKITNEESKQKEAIN